MATPCPRCGATKTESTRHGIIYRTFWRFGLHLRRCSFCNRYRLFKRADRNRPHPDDMTREELEDYFNRKVAQAGGIPRGGARVPRPPRASESSAPKAQSATVTAEPLPPPARDGFACPKCGSDQYRRSRRKFYERWLGRPRMARCRMCSHRFPFPT